VIPGIDLMEDNLKKVLVELRELRRLLGAGQRRLLTVSETAASLGIAAKTLRNKLSDGTFPVRPVRLAGRTLFRVTDLDNLVDSLGGGG
jgi:predicted DNA-binding transcriptional regulator AlpA